MGRGTINQAVIPFEMDNREYCWKGSYEIEETNDPEGEFSPGLNDVCATIIDTESLTCYDDETGEYVPVEMTGSMQIKIEILIEREL